MTPCETNNKEEIEVVAERGSAPPDGLFNRTSTAQCGGLLPVAPVVCFHQIYPTSYCFRLVCFVSVEFLGCQYCDLTETINRDAQVVKTVNSKETWYEARSKTISLAGCNAEGSTEQ